MFIQVLDLYLFAVFPEQIDLFLYVLRGRLWKVLNEYREFPTPSRRQEVWMRVLLSKGWAGAEAGHVGGIPLSRERERAFLTAGVGHTKA